MLIRRLALSGLAARDARAKEIVDTVRMRAFSEKNLEKLFAEKPEKPKIQAETKR